MKSAITFLTGAVMAVTGLVMRACSSGVEAELARYWCGPDGTAIAAQAHAHCPGCGIAAAGFGLMIAGIIVGSLPRRRAARERI